MRNTFIITLLLGIFTTTGVMAEEIITEERSVPDFNKIEIQGSVDVIYIQGQSVQVKIEGERKEVENVITKVTNNKLIVDYKNNRSWFSGTSDLVVYAQTRELTAVKIDGSGDFETENRVKGKAFSIAIHGSGDSYCKLDVDNVEVKVHGSGDISFSGVNNRMHITVNGSGDVEGDNLDLQQATIKQYGSGDVKVEGTAGTLILNQSGSGDCHARPMEADIAEIRKSGSGDAFITTRKKVSVQSSESGDTHCYGSPSSVKESVSGSGELFIK